MTASTASLEHAGAADAPWGAPAEEVLDKLGTDTASGLSGEEAARRLEVHGPNRPAREPRPQYLRIAARQLADPLVLLLAAAAVVSAVVGEEIEAGAIAAIVVLGAALGFAQEASADRAVLALRAAFEQRATVVRGGAVVEIPAHELVTGDLLVAHEGDRVAADARLVTSASCAVDESALTGESLPVEKSPAAVPPDTPLAERASMLWAGTAVTRGRARAVVTATGDDTEMGQVAGLAAGATPPRTPLQRRLDGLSRALALVGIGVTIVLASGMLAWGESVREAFLVGAAVAVAAVPEGLTATVTIALAQGAVAMARRGAIVRRLAAVETLGEATVIATDKTGTLTRNRLAVVAVEAAGGRTREEVLAAGALATTGDADPLDAALRDAAGSRDRPPRLSEVPFDPERRRTTVVVEDANGAMTVVKGAPETVLALAGGDPREHDRLAARAEDWAASGLRVLAVADGVGADERSLAPVGLVGLEDPLRPRAAESIERARAAGIRVLMLTGDHPATAASIGRRLRLAEEDVYARVTPAEKLELVRREQERGEVVAVTGDGINDAPALRRADVGVAMGQSGTEAAREAADLVLTDDDFATIVAAVEEGRRIDDNLRTFVAFLLSANFGEVLLFAFAVLAGLGSPMTVVQVLTVNLLTDGLPAIALARDPASGDTMRRRPRRLGALFSPALRAWLGVAGLVVGLAATVAYLLGRALDPGAAQTMAYATIALAELALVYALRTPGPFWRGPRNRLLNLGVLASAAVVAATIAAPPLRDAFGTVALGPRELAIVLALALLPGLAVELAKAVRRARIRERAEPAAEVPGRPLPPKRREWRRHGSNRAAKEGGRR
jgi:Ca2+-transporting ATPase